MDTNAIIEILGGPAKVADVCGISRPAVTLWKRDGIPPPRWDVIVAHARTQGIDDVNHSVLHAAYRVHKATA